MPLPTLPFHLHHTTYCLSWTRTDCHTNTATAPLSVCHEAPAKTLPIQADLSWGPLPLIPLWTAVFPFFFSSYCILLPFCPFCLNHHLLLLGSETHSLHACLSLCQSSNRVLSLSIALDIRLFLLLILWPLSSKLLFTRLPDGNLVESNTKHTLRSLCIWCCSVTTMLSSALTALCLPFYSSLLLLWPLFLGFEYRLWKSILTPVSESSQAKF